MGGGKKDAKNPGDVRELTSQDAKYAEDFLKGRKEELLFVDWVNIPKGKTLEPKLLIIGRARLYVVSPKMRMEKESHLVELRQIESKDPNQVTVVYESWNTPIMSPRADEIINALMGALAACFPSMPPEKAVKINVEPSSRVREIPSGEGAGVCGGFNDTYRVLSDYYQTPVREDILWDVQNLFTVNNVTEFNLEDFEQPLLPEQLLPLLASLRYNSYFTGFIVKNINLDLKKTFPEIGKCLSTNTAITKLILSNCGMTKDACIAVFDQLRTNDKSEINIIDVSRNPNIDEKAMTSVANFIGAKRTGLIKLDVSRCGVSKVGMSALGQALRKNVHMISTLTHLNISHNHLDAEGSSTFAAWLANPNKLSEINIANSNANLETIMPALLRGCPEIRNINVSGNKLGRRAAQSLCQFLQSTDSLNTLNLDNTGLTADEMVLIVQAIGENPYLQDFHLSMAGNRLGMLGSKQMSAISSNAPNIVDLNVADNEFNDEGLSLVCQTFANSTSLRSIDLSRNFSAKPTKNSRYQVVEDLISLINSDCPLETLLLRGSKTSNLKTDLLSFIDGVGTNSTLLSLDISGQQIGNKGAIAISKMLQTNRKLKRLVWEDNATTLFGFNAVASGLERNRSLKEMPMPILDITNAIRSDDPIRLQKVLSRLQQLLARNQNPSSLKGGSGANAFGHLNIFSSGEREVLERLKFKVKSTTRDTNPEQALLLNDVENNDNNLAALHNIVETHQVAMADEVTAKLKTLAAEIMPVFDEHFRNMVSAIVETVKDRYKSLDSDTVRLLNTNICVCVEPLEEKAVESILADAASAEIISKANEILTSAFEITTDYIYEKLNGGLTSIIEEVKTAPQPESHPVPSPSPAIPDEPDETPLSPKGKEPTPEPVRATSSSEPKLAPVAVAETKSDSGAPKPSDSKRAPFRQPPGVPARGGASPNTTPAAGAGSPARGAPAGGSPRGAPTRGKPLNVPAGLDTSKMIPGGGRGFQLPPVGVGRGGPPREAPKDEAPPPPVAEPAKEEKKGGLFGKKTPAPAPTKPIGGTKKNPAPAVKPVPGVKKAAKPSGETENIKAIDAALKEVPDTPTLVHHTKDRPMIQQKRRPPTRRPRAQAED